MILTQSNFPRLWLLFQRTIGGSKDKQELALSAWSGQRNILEIGCSVGNIADIFRGRAASYVGLDIDAKAIALATKRFAKNRGGGDFNLSIPAWRTMPLLARVTILYWWPACCTMWMIRRPWIS